MSNAGALSVGAIAERVKRQFGDESSIQITDADIFRWINDAQRELALHNQLLQAKATAPAVANVSEYTLPADVLSVRSIRYNGKKLVGVSPQEAEEYIDDTSDTGTPERYWVWADRLTLYPAPDNSPGAMSIFYTRTPSNITNLADFPELPSQYHNRIVEYCLKQAYELDENWAAAQVKGQEWQEGIQQLKGEESWVERDFYPSITTLPGD